MKYYSADSIRHQILVLLKNWGLTEEDAAVTADVMVDTDLSGVDSHGISMVMMYDAMMRSGEINPTATPAVVRDGPAFAVLDANHGLGHPVAHRAMKLAMEKAKGSGIGCVSVFNSHHFGAAGYYVRLAAEEGLIALATTTTRQPAVIPTGAKAGVLGTNPLAFAAPGLDTATFVLDMSTSIVASNKVKTYALRDEPLPAGWVTDADGQAVTDPHEAYALIRSSGDGGLVPLGGSSTTLGGHKGFGLSIMVQILSSALSNAAQPGNDGAHDNIGHFFLVIDPEHFNPDGGAARVTGDLLKDLRSAQALPGHQVVIPGEPEAASRRQREATGIPLPESLLTKIEEICSANKVPNFLEEVTFRVGG